MLQTTDDEDKHHMYDDAMDSLVVSQSVQLRIANTGKRSVVGEHPLLTTQYVPRIPW